MARVALASQTATADGITLTYTAANGTGGNSFDRYSKLFVTNGSGSTVTLTFTTPQSVGGNAIADKTATVAAGATRVFSLEDDVYKEPGGKVWVDFSSATSVTIAALAD